MCCLEGNVNVWQGRERTGDAAPQRVLIGREMQLTQ